MIPTEDATTIYVVIDLLSVEETLIAVEEIAAVVLQMEMTTQKDGRPTK